MIDRILTAFHRFLCKHSMMGHEYITTFEGKVIRLECMKCGDQTEGWKT